MHESELWITKLFNDHLAGLGNAFLGIVGMQAEHRPWSNYITMELVVVLLMMLLFAFLRPRLSVDHPGKLQHLFEVIHDFLRGESEDQVGHGGARYLPYFGTIFLFILFGNLIGIIPGFESPTQSPAVPLGCALATFLYYNFVGLKEQGVGKYLAHFAGPMPFLAPLMIPIELMSHLARPLSLTIRLYANMYAGEKVTMVFLGLTYFAIPAVFMGLHVFVSLLQAYIFALLTMMYVAGAVSHEH
ncbi:MAG TPA: F0F1 ATP synthase subunit A [Phycisphaerae bacterium]|jgi:F-type H+-transporting ATPase subunit a|nr:F0F1 ATP synthase subunit A [Phycisphaerae bacterium]